MRSQCCHIVMSQIHKMITSPWGHSAVTEWCSPGEVIMMSLWYRNYDITCVTCVWGHYDMSLPHHHEVRVLSQYDVTETWYDYIIMRSQCRHSVMSQIHKMTKSPWGHSFVTEWCSPCEVIMISLWYRNYDITCVTCLWGHCDMSLTHHHEVIVLSQYNVTDTWDDYITMRSQCHHSVMSQIHEMTTSSWGHSVVTGRCSPCEIIMISKLWHHQCAIFVRSQWYKLSTSPWGHNVVTVWCHRYWRWPDHHEVTVLSHDDAHLMRSLWCPHDIKIMTSHVWDVS